MNYLDYLKYVEKEIIKAEEYKIKLEEERRNEYLAFRDMISKEGLPFIPDLLPERYRKIYYMQINTFNLKFLPVENKIRQLREIERRLKSRIEAEIEKNILSDKRDKESDYASLFIGTLKNKCKTIKWPTYKELSEFTGISERTWKRRFRDILFLETLLKKINELCKKQKSKRWKEIWEERLNKINDCIDKVTFSKDALNRKTIEFDERKFKATYDDLNDEYKKEINR